MKGLFSEEQKEFIISNFQTTPYKEIGERLGGYSAAQIAGWLSNNGYKKDNRSIFSKEDIKFIRSNYLSMTYAEIGKVLGYSDLQIKGWVNHNCDKKLRTFNNSYFSKIDSANKAYWVGFIFADGALRFSNESRNYELGIELNRCDEKLLVDFNNELGGVHKITYRHREKYICGHKTKSVSDTACLRIYSKQIVEDLIKIGVVPNKTNDTIFPVIEDYFFDFLRGYIDGDGCIHIAEKNFYPQVKTVSAFPEVFQYLKDKLDSIEIKSGIYKENDRKYQFHLSGKHASNLLDLIYYDEAIQKLQRKYEKYILLKNGRLDQKWLSN